MKNPLNKRFIRDLKEEFGKYMVIFILMVFSIALTSGYIVGNGSMQKAYDDSFEKYNIEDGNFSVKNKLNIAQIKAIEEYGINVFENFYSTLNEVNDIKVRVFRNRSEVNKVCLMEGTMPTSINEIALDRAFCDNNSLNVGDCIETDQGKYLITGTVALSDYSALFENNSDMMFDAVKFAVGIVADEQFINYRDITYNYSFKYDEPINDESIEKDVADELSKNINSEVSLETFTPRYANQAIQFTGTDITSDQAMMETLFYIIVVIMAFVFALTTINTINKEMSVIGTLLASGYSKKELMIHYMALPLIVTIISAIIGNILGYTYMKDAIVALYYNSYSLPTYHTIWSMYGFVKTTMIPLIMMVVINILILNFYLNMPIMNFLRRQTTSSNKSKALSLNKRLPFMFRYRFRIFLKNIPSYVLMLLGILFANLLIMFGLDFPVLIDNYEAEMLKNPLAPYITMLNVPVSMNRDDHRLENSIEMLNFYNGVQTDNETAEKISAYSLNTLANESAGYDGEAVTIYGIVDNSKYIDIDLDNNEIYISSALADKFELEKGDQITLKEKYEEKYYSFEIDGIYDYLGSMCVFMEIDDLNKAFDMDEGTFVGYLSQTPIEDIDNKYIGTVIDEDALTKLSRQLNNSFGSLMDMVVVFAAVIYVVLIYVITKMLIDSNSQSISMSKIMGYSNLEIAGLYILTTTIVFIVLLIGSIPFESKGLIWLFRNLMISKMSGWLPLVIGKDIIIKMIIIALSSFTIVSIFELRRIAKVPMDQALKNVE